MTNDLKNIDNFILDFGGVLFDVDHKKTALELLKYSRSPEKLKNLDVKSFFESEAFASFEKGEISPEIFRKRVVENYDLEIDAENFDKAWNALLLELYPDAADNVSELKKFGKVFLLSNTNETHYRNFFPKREAFFDLFDYCLFSFQTGYRKPQPEIFEYALEKFGADKSRSIFLDDSEANVEAARKVGLPAFLISPENSLAKFIKLLKKARGA